MWRRANVSFDFHALEKEDTTIQGILAILRHSYRKEIYKHTFNIPLVIVFQVYINYSH